MPQLITASPRLTVHLYKTISRGSIDGQSAVSERYEGKDAYIDLTPFLGENSAVRTSKSVREPAGAFSITITDQPQESIFSKIGITSMAELESISGLVEPMDMVEIRMWNGVGAWTRSKNGKPLYPIIMRGFVSDIQRSQSMGDGGRPQRSVTITGQDFGKIWQTFRVIYLASYAEQKALLTNFGLLDLYGIEAKSAMASPEFVRVMMEKIINPHLDKLIPKTMEDMPRQIKTGDSISVKHGVVHPSYQASQGSIYEILHTHGDVGIWNELYTEDREDGVHCVYRAIPALHLTAPKGKDRRIQDDALEPVYVDVPDDMIVSLALGRTDANVANFYWLNNARFDMLTEMQRKLASIPAGDSRVSLQDYPNTAVKYYGVRVMMADTQQGDDAIVKMTSGLTTVDNAVRSVKQEAWLDKRRRLMMEMNKDNVVLERGTARIKGGPMRDDGVEAMKAGDYAMFHMGRLNWEAYVVQIDHEFLPFQSYTTTLALERGTGFAVRTSDAGSSSPWLAEQASRFGF